MIKKITVWRNKSCQDSLCLVQLKMGAEQILITNSHGHSRIIATLSRIIATLLIFIALRGVASMTVIPSGAGLVTRRRITKNGHGNGLATIKQVDRYREKISPQHHEAKTPFCPCKQWRENNSRTSTEISAWRIVGRLQMED